MTASVMRRAGLLAATLAFAGGGAVAATTPPDTTAPASTDTAPTDTTMTTDMAPAPATAVDLTVTADGIEGLPADLAAGLVDVTVTAEGPVEVDFTLVEPGTDPATFVDDLIATVFAGGPIPDYFLNNAGVVGGEGTITLDEGEYIVWADQSAPDAETTAADLTTATLTVGPGDDAAVVPPGDSNMKAGDYLFDVDAVAGGETVTFTNSSDNQLHHVVLMDFGTNDPAVVEEKLPEFLASAEDAPPPEGIDMAQVNFEFGGSGVFGPGGSGTFAATFEPGRTYVALCFISDREGGAPHAIQHQMFDVFTVDA